MADPSLNVTFSLDGHSVHLGLGLLKGAIARGDLTTDTPVLIEQDGVEIYAGAAGASPALAGLFPEPVTDQGSDETQSEIESDPPEIAAEAEPEPSEVAPPAPVSDPVVPKSISPPPGAPPPLRPAPPPPPPPPKKEIPSTPDPAPRPRSGCLPMIIGLLVVSFIVSRCFGDHDPKPTPGASSGPSASSTSPTAPRAPRVETQAQEPAPETAAPDESAQTAEGAPPAEALPPKDAPVASFACSKARAWSEVMICKSPALADADRELADVYRRLASNVSGSALTVLIREQRRWNLDRDLCRRSPEGDACLLDMIGRRTQELQGRMGTEAEPAPEEPQPPVAEGPRRLDNLAWDRAPDLRVAYPVGAENLRGRVEMRCEVIVDLRVTCAVTRETPEGRGFGKVAVSVFKRARLRAYQDGRAVKEGDWFAYVVNFKPAD